MEDTQIGWLEVEKMAQDGTLEAVAARGLDNIRKMRKLKEEQMKLIDELEAVYRVMALGVNPGDVRAWGLCKAHLQACHEETWRRMSMGEDVPAWRAGQLRDRRNLRILPALFNYYVSKKTGERVYLKEPVVIETMETVTEYDERRKLEFEKGDS